MNGGSTTYDTAGNVTGMTMKAYRRRRFFDLCRAYKQVDPVREPELFIRLSLALHAAKGDVPRAFWRYARRPTAGAA